MATTNQTNTVNIRKKQPVFFAILNNNITNNLKCNIQFINNFFFGITQMQQHTPTTLQYRKRRFPLQLFIVTGFGVIATT